MFAFAVFMLLCVDVMVMSSAFFMSFTGACVVGVSAVYMLNSVVIGRRLVRHQAPKISTYYPDCLLFVSAFFKSRACFASAELIFITTTNLLRRRPDQSLLLFLQMSGGGVYPNPGPDLVLS